MTSGYELLERFERVKKYIPMFDSYQFERLIRHCKIVEQNYLKKNRSVKTNDK